MHREVPVHFKVGGNGQPTLVKAECLKNVYVTNLSISWSVCPWQAFPALPIVCGYGQEPAIE